MIAPINCQYQRLAELTTIGDDDYTATVLLDAVQYASRRVLTLPR